MVRHSFSRIGCIVLGLLVGAAALPGAAHAQHGKIEVKSYERIGKDKIQVDLSLADTGALYRDLRDYLKDVLTARGNPVGRSGPLAAKLNVNYAMPIEPRSSTGNDPAISGPAGPNAAGPTAGALVPDRPPPAFRRPEIAPARGNALRVGITVYREQGGKVVWTGEASCIVAFADANAAGRGLIDQLIALLDRNQTGAPDCPK